MRVKANALGFDGTDLRQPGDLFDMPDGTEGSWFDEVDANDNPLPKKPKKKSGSTTEDPPLV